MLKSCLVATTLFSVGVVSYAQTPIRMVGIGATFEQAKNDAFRKAIEFKLGTVIVSNFETSGNDVIRNEILSYSSGYVDNFEIVSQTYVGNKIQVVVDVNVSTSKIANRILSNSQGNKPINGMVLNEQFNTFMDTKQKGDKLLETTMAKYPEYSFDIKHVKTDFSYDYMRNPLLQVHYNLKYNQNWITALNETLQFIGDSNSRRRTTETAVLVYDNPNAILEHNRFKNYNFNDYATVTLLRDILSDNEPRVKVSFLEGSKSLYSSCHKISSHSFYNDNARIKTQDAVVFFGPAQVNDSVQVALPKNQNILNRTTELKVDIVRKNSC
jgi:hypothetical protein